MMEIYSVGPDESYDIGCDNVVKNEEYVWMIYWYYAGNYEGDGDAVCLGKDGMLYQYHLGHCSCYGPFDDFGFNRNGRTVQEYLGDVEKPFELDREEIVDKVKELLGVV